MTVARPLFAVTALLSMLSPTLAHDWYPKDCCHNDDCAPVEAITQLIPIAGGAAHMVVRSKHGSAIVPPDFPARASKDGRMHICMRHSKTDPYADISVICLFLPPTM